jgi:hypothetical protein
VVKYVAYAAWRSPGVHLLRVASPRLSTSLFFRSIRLLIGVCFGIMVFFVGGMMHLEGPANPLLMYGACRLLPLLSRRLILHRRRCTLDIGETANDISVKTTMRLRSDLELQTLVQYEAWLAPVLARSRQSDVLGTVQLTCWPQHLPRKSQEKRQPEFSKNFKPQQ